MNEWPIITYPEGPLVGTTPSDNIPLQVKGNEKLPTGELRDMHAWKEGRYRKDAHIDTIDNMPEF